VKAVALFLAILAGTALAQERRADVVEATTAKGEKVYLMPDGRWEFADPKKAEPQRAQRSAEEQRERAAQGGLLGIGRRVYPGDPDYNRGSLNPNRR
jgi:hypothetical protein